MNVKMSAGFMLLAIRSAEQVKTNEHEWQVKHQDQQPS
jgi:hypothetical protein